MSWKEEACKQSLDYQKNLGKGQAGQTCSSKEGKKNAQRRNSVESIMSVMRRK